MPGSEIGNGGEFKRALIAHPIDQQDEEIHACLRIGQQSVHGDFVYPAWRSGRIGVGMPFAEIVKPFRIITVATRQGFEIAARFAGPAPERDIIAAAGLCRRFDNPEIRFAHMLAKKYAADLAVTRAP